MFKLKDFVMETLRGMVGHYPDFQIRQFALNWYSKGVLTEDDLMEIENILNPPMPEETPEEIPEETPEETLELL